MRTTRTRPYLQEEPPASIHSLPHVTDDRKLNLPREYFRMIADELEANLLALPEHIRPRSWIESVRLLHLTARCDGTRLNTWIFAMFHRSDVDSDAEQCAEIRSTLNAEYHGYPTTGELLDAVDRILAFDDAANAWLATELLPSEGTRSAPPTDRSSAADDGSARKRSRGKPSGIQPIRDRSAAVQPPARARPTVLFDLPSSSDAKLLRSAVGRRQWYPKWLELSCLATRKRLWLPRFSALQTLRLELGGSLRTSWRAQYTGRRIQFPFWNSVEVADAEPDRASRLASSTDDRTAFDMAREGFDRAMLASWLDRQLPECDGACRELIDELALALVLEDLGRSAAVARSNARGTTRVTREELEAKLKKLRISISFLFADMLHWRRLRGSSQLRPATQAEGQAEALEARLLRLLTEIVLGDTAGAALGLAIADYWNRQTAVALEVNAQRSACFQEAEQRRTANPFVRIETDAEPEFETDSDPEYRFQPMLVVRPLIFSAISTRARLPSCSRTRRLMVDALAELLEVLRESKLLETADLEHFVEIIAEAVGDKQARVLLRVDLDKFTLHDQAIGRELHAAALPLVACAAAFDASALGTAACDHLDALVRERADGRDRVASIAASLAVEHGTPLLPFRCPEALSRPLAASAFLVASGHISRSPDDRMPGSRIESASTRASVLLYSHLPSHDGVEVTRSGYQSRARPSDRTSAASPFAARRAFVGLSLWSMAHSALERVDASIESSATGSSLAIPLRGPLAYVASASWGRWGGWDASSTTLHFVHGYEGPASTRASDDGEQDATCLLPPLRAELHSFGTSRSPTELRFKLEPSLLLRLAALPGRKRFAVRIRQLVDRNRDSVPSAHILAGIMDGAGVRVVSLPWHAWTITSHDLLPAVPFRSFEHPAGSADAGTAARPGSVDALVDLLVELGTETTPAGAAETGAPKRRKAGVTGSAKRGGGSAKACTPLDNAMALLKDALERG